MMKKVLCLIDTLGMGGAERQMIGLASMLHNKGYQVDLVTYYSHDYNEELVRRYGIGALTLHVKSSRLSKLKAIRNHIRQSGGYDCVIAFKDGPCVISCLLRMVGMHFKLIVSERNTTQTKDWSTRIKFFLYHFADFIVPNSYSQESFIARHFPALLDKTTTITNFTDTDLFRPGSIEPDVKIRILTVARIARQKNVLKYLEAIAEFIGSNSVDVQFEWFGDVQTGEEDYGQSVRDYVKKLGLSDVISFHPATTNILEKYQQCTVFCLPSIYEGFPNVICEAMSCGKPIICSHICDNHRIVSENENGLLFNPNDTLDIVKALTQICSFTRPQLDDWGRKSRSIAETLFSMEAFVQKYIVLIEK